VFNPFGMLESERSAAVLLGHATSSLDLAVHKFAQALALADYCDAQRAPHHQYLEQVRLRDLDDWSRYHQALEASRQYINWKQLAADAGAITIYNYHELIQTVDGLIGQVPTAKERVDRELLKRGRSAFYGAFPDYIHVRFAVAHAGKPFASPEVNDEQRLPGSDGMIINMLNDRTLISTVNKKQVSYSLTAESLNALKLSAHLMNQAFEPVKSFTRQYNSAQQRETPAPPAGDQNPPP
jgi:hypothetical protein